jgi:hypothetical protein
VEGVRARVFLCGTGSRTRTAVTISGVFSRGLDGSGSGPVIVVQHAAEALPALDLSRASEVAGFWTDEFVPQPLMIAVCSQNRITTDCDLY